MGSWDDGRVCGCADAEGRRRTDLCSSVHSQDVDTLDDGGAGVVYAVEHGLGEGSGG